MKIMLTSAGIRNELLEDSLRELVDEENIRIAFIPTAADAEKGDKSWLIDDLVNCRKLGVVDIVNISALKKEEWLPRLEEANVIFVGGGDTSYLMICWD
jgi:peptidase E